MRRFTVLRHLLVIFGLWLPVLGQTVKYKKCIPQNGDVCDPNPALASTIEVDFTTQTDAAPFDLHGNKGVEFQPDDGTVITLNSEKQVDPTLFLSQYIFFGRVEVVLRSAPGRGIVTSVMLQSDTLDEIYFEWIGSDSNQVRTNYVRDGNAEGYDREANHTVSNPADESHNYTIDWTKDRINWFIDGKQVRQLTYASAHQGSQFPQTPAMLNIGTWVAGRQGSPEGTIEWAGGLADFDDGPFVATVQTVKVTDYSNGVDHAADIMWDSIEVRQSPPEISVQHQPPESPDNDKADGLGPGAIAGIVIGAVAGCAILLGAGWFIINPGRKRTGREEEHTVGDAAGDATADATADAFLMGGKGELDGRPSEKKGAQEYLGPSELQSPQEMEGQGKTIRPLSELEGRQIAAELDGGETKKEKSVAVYALRELFAPVPIEAP
ncbi:concanavalin A-like lectin/glucanase domain-containing protein [Plectosphaerella plurivora]|uniref:Concanavalin A-like lectin/glucanase domain-containing protein n=1 Tax=Plectosphaerella plurivora TaxID=936078 RepID=A0A9P9AAP0_9PEZI|nr:concanavalin A-like lectin/glucanase domain-containing protein [Plectosphaerella plurivora]